MRIFISYKYKKVVDKEALKEALTHLSDQLVTMGHSTFILGKDIQNWEAKKKSGGLTNISPIVKNLVKSNLILAYIDSDVQSVGLAFELYTAKMLKKKTVIAVKSGIRYDNDFKFPVIYFKNLEELEIKLEKYFKTL
jgi:hypothetical protein